MSDTIIAAIITGIFTLIAALVGQKYSQKLKHRSKPLTDLPKEPTIGELEKNLSDRVEVQQGEVIHTVNRKKIESIINHIENYPEYPIVEGIVALLMSITVVLSAIVFVGVLTQNLLVAVVIGIPVGALIIRLIHRQVFYPIDKIKSKKYIRCLQSYNVNEAERQEVKRIVTSIKWQKRLRKKWEDDHFETVINNVKYVFFRFD